MTETYGFYFGQPWWLVASLAVIPLVWLAHRNLAALGQARRLAAIILRVMVLLLLVALLARPMLVRTNHRATVIAVVDRSRSIPVELANAALDYLAQAAGSKGPEDQLAVVDVAEAAHISALPSGDETVRRRNTTLAGQQTRLADGIQMAMAIAPPDTATRIVLVSEGNETEGDLKEVAETTVAANHIPIDVLPLRYRYDSEVLFRRLAAPSRARSHQTIDLRFLLDSTADVRGGLLLTLNGKPVNLSPETPDVAIPVELKAGTNAKTVSLPVGSAGLHQFEAVFIPDDARDDRVAENNRASAMTYVAGPGNIRVYDTEDAGANLARALQEAAIDVRYAEAGSMPDELTRLMDADAVVLVNTPVQYLSMAQQDMLCHYVNDLGGGLVMVGGPDSFGAGGWIGSPVAEILPVDLDPPQKKQMPRGALVLVIDRSGSMVGEKVEICKVAAGASVRLLSRLDLVGILVFDATHEWLVPLRPASDKDYILSHIRSLGAGGGTIMGPAMQMAYDALQKVEGGIKHVILLTDGMTSDAERCERLGMTMGDAGISVSTVAVGEQANTELLFDISGVTEGRFYRVTDPMSIPEIFIKEAQVVRRSMIIEQTFTPQVAYSLSETIKGILPPLPALDGYVLTGPKGGLSQLVLASSQADPILATCQSGLGRCVAFTSSADSRWAGQWMQWAHFARFWEQVIRWAGRPAQSTDCEIFADVEGQEVTINVEASDTEGRFVSLAGIEGQVLTPEMEAEPLSLTQTGPGQYAGRFHADASGSYIVNIQYRRVGGQEGNRLANTIVSIPFAPEFRDLTDNAPLLEEVSRLTGGRVLPSDPNRADLFDYAGLKFPQRHQPLLRPLMLIWIALFLLDVAVRRVVLDVRAGLRRARAWVFSAATRREQDATISRLQATRRKLQEQWSARTAHTVVMKRYDGADKYEGQVLDTEPQHKVETPKPADAVGAGPGARAGQPRAVAPTHIDQLLEAKRKARQRSEENR